MDVSEKFAAYPDHVRPALEYLRSLIFEVARENGMDDLKETLKWNEPSYLTKNGTTVRIDWKSSSPNEYAMYFHCRTKLVETFKVLYSDLFRYQGKRAIMFALGCPIPEKELKHCIFLALRYHQLKTLPFLGA